MNNINDKLNNAVKANAQSTCTTCTSCGAKLLPDGPIEGDYCDECMAIKNTEPDAGAPYVRGYNR